MYFILNYYPMKGYIFVNYLNKRSKGLTMQINFHSLIWSYLPIIYCADIFGHACMYIWVLDEHS